jgi:uncharacterized membrane protein
LAQDPIEQAIGYWLSNDDAAAFPALSSLAEGGDERAMLFLGAIEPLSLDSAYLAGLDRETRNRMLRAPGGLSGKTWLGHITSNTVLASALLAARDGDPLPLLTLGQPHAASEAILAAFNSAPWSLVAIDQVTPVPDTLRHLVWHGADLALSTEISGLTLSDDEKAGYRAALAEAADPKWQGSLQLALFQSMHTPYSILPAPPLVAALTGHLLRRGEFDVRTLADFAATTPAQQQAAVAQARALLATAPETAPLRRLCAEACPVDPNSCTATVWSLTGAGMTVGAFHTPLDNLIPQSAYLASPRYLADLRRAARAPPQDADLCGNRLMVGD